MSPTNLSIFFIFNPGSIQFIFYHSATPASIASRAISFCIPPIQEMSELPKKHCFSPMVCAEDTEDRKDIVDISTSSPSNLFWNKSSMHRFEDHFSRRSICLERRWRYHELRDLPIFPIFESRKWLAVLTKFSSSSCEKLVREFYANLPSDIGGDDFDHKYQVYVRGKWISFDSNVIKEHLDLGDSYSSDIVQPDHSVPLNVVASELFGTETKMTSDQLFDRSRLTGLYMMINNVVSTNIDSSGHKSKFSADRAYLLYTIGTRQPLNLSVFIFNVICAASKATSWNILPFGRLITEILAKSNIVPYSSDKVVPPIEPLTCVTFKSALKHIYGSCPPAPCISVQGKPMPNTAKATSSSKPLKTLQSRRSRYNVFPYTHSRGTAKATSSSIPPITSQSLRGPCISFPHKAKPSTAKATWSSLPPRTFQPLHASHISVQYKPMPNISKSSSSSMPPMTLQSLHASLSFQISELHAHMSDEFRNIRQDIAAL